MALLRLKLYKIRFSLRLKLRYLVQLLIHLQVKEHSTSITRMQLLIDTRRLSGILVMFQISIWSGLLLAVKRTFSAVWTAAGARTLAALPARMALPLAYVSKIRAKPIYRRKAVTRLCDLKNKKGSE